MPATYDYNTEQVKKLLKDDRTITCEEMAQELETSVGSVHFILRNRLKMCKVSARWLPHRLTPEQAERRLTIAAQLLYGYDSEGRNFLERIAAVDETWIRSYELEMRRQSTEWHTPCSPRPAKYRRQCSRKRQYCRLRRQLFPTDDKNSLHRIPPDDNFFSGTRPHSAGQPDCFIR